MMLCDTCKHCVDDIGVSSCSKCKVLIKFCLVRGEKIKVIKNGVVVYQLNVKECISYEKTE